MKINPVGHRVLIKPDKVEEVSKGGIIVSTEGTKRLEQNAQVIGEVIAIGADSWKEFDAPWCKVGDKVTYQKYSGMRIPGEDALILINDLDITGVVNNE